jgi:hypothetical protein
MSDLLCGTVYTVSELRETITRLRLLADDLESVCKGIVPAVPDVSVSEWFLQYKAAPCIVGKVSGHPTVRGDYVATTEVFFLNESLGLARTSTRWYRLGRPLHADADVH